MLAKALPAAAAVVVCVLVPAAPASAQTGHTLALAGPATAPAGQPTVYQATGVVPDDVFLNRYLNVYAIPASVVPICPATLQNAIQLSYASAAHGGDTVASTVPAEGTFTLPVAYTPTASGSMLLCGYVHEGVETMATATLPVTVPAGGDDAPAAGTKPANVSKPTVKRSGRKLVCRRGTWSGSPTAYAYSWRAGGKRVADATRSTLRVTRKLRGRKVRCAVTATNATGATTTLSRAVRAPRR